MTDPAREAAREATLQELGLLDPASDPTLDRIVRLTRSMSGAPMAAFSVADGDTLFYKSREGLPVDRIPLELSGCRHVFESETVTSVEDTRQDARFKANPYVQDGHFGGYAGWPVRAANGVLVGVLCVMDAKPLKLDAATRAALDDLRQLLEDTLLLRSLSLIDPLTGLHNRRHLDQVLPVELRRAFRFLLPLTVLVLDIDHFKAYNDTYGHLQGDEALRQVASLLSSRVQRAGDLIVRYGGEEFVLVLPQTPMAGAERVAERILRSVAEANIEHRGAPRGFLTLSVGGAVANEEIDLEGGERLLLESADAALYEAKDSGRNAWRLRMVGAVKKMDESV